MKFFDANAALIPTPQSFPRTQRPGAISRTAEALGREMRGCGITRALVYNAKCMWLHPNVGNYELTRHISGRPGLYAAWVLAPSQLRDAGSPEISALLDEMEGHGVRAARLIPRHPLGQAYPLDDWRIGDLLSGLEERGFPVFIDSVDYRICEKHPGLSVIFPSYTNAHADYTLLRRYENLYVPTSGASNHRGLEEMVDIIGADRVIFSTVEEHASSIVSPGCWVNHVLYADLDDSEKRLIASGNLERLLGKGIGGEIPEDMSSVDTSGIEGLARSGLPLKGYDLIDVHAHVGESVVFRVPDSSPESIISVMDRLGVSRACVNHYYALFGDMVRGNDEVAKLVSEFPTRFIGVGVIDPNYPRMGMEAEMKRCVEILGFRIIKIHPARHIHDVPILDPRYEPIWESANRYGIIVLVHTSKNIGYGYDYAPVEPNDAGIIAAKYPRVTFIFGHSGNNYPGLLDCIDVATRYPNIYLDTATGALLAPGAIEMAVKELGSDRILFGTDTTILSMTWTIGCILYAKISDCDKIKILGNNVSGLYKKACANVERRLEGE